MVRIPAQNESDRFGDKQPDDAGRPTTRIPPPPKPSGLLSKFQSLVDQAREKGGAGEERLLDPETIELPENPYTKDMVPRPFGTLARSAIFWGNTFTIFGLAFFMFGSMFVIVFGSAFLFPVQAGSNMEIMGEAVPVGETAPFWPGGLILLPLLLFPTIGFFMFRSGAKDGLKRLRLLRDGYRTKARLFSSEPTNVRVNNRPIIKYGFVFGDQRGHRQTFHDKTLRRDIEDVEDILFNPDKPGEAMLLDATNGFSEIDREGVVRGTPVRVALRNLFFAPFILIPLILTPLFLRGQSEENRDQEGQEKREVDEAQHGLPIQE